MEDDKRVVIFEHELEKIIEKLMREVLEKILSIDPNESLDRAKEILIEANSIINLACGEDDDKYERYRFRLIVSHKGQACVVQGDEIDVEYYLYDQNDEQE